MSLDRLLPSYRVCSSCTLRLAEPRIVLENSNPFTIDGVILSGGASGECIIQFPQVGKVVMLHDIIWFAGVG